MKNIKLTVDKTIPKESYFYSIYDENKKQRIKCLKSLKDEQEIALEDDVEIISIRSFYGRSNRIQVQKDMHLHVSKVMGLYAMYGLLEGVFLLFMQLFIKEWWIYGIAFLVMLFTILFIYCHYYLLKRID
ncbi:hypothetical protein GMA11_07685 [Granulicatella sp. zg-ZJ]|uniref:hypothetical protein n=1 Tax=Granulicatella sp. zg-ZJ TaxID=2678504 RepID=UPI0013D41898|nr:hypothetical protein [Granulicatella sp. zg-ZJ]NEW63274.1 hypothetical protein [Granulicatella sp. zg-ZJ]